MAGTQITDFLEQGLAASRPAAPDAQTTTLSFYYAYDTGALSYYDWNAAAWVSVISGARTFPMDFGISGGGSVISTGIALDIGPFDFDITLKSVTLLADQSGSIVLDFWSAPYSAYPPTVANSIVGAAPPTISAAVKSQDTTLTGWTTLVPAGNTIRVNVNSATSITRLNVALKYTRSL